MERVGVDLSIVIPCYNRGEKLHKTLSTIIPFCSDRKIEIVLSDDSDDLVSGKILSDLGKSFPEVVLYSKNKDRLGYADNLIKGISLSCGKYLFFLLDEDSLVIDQFLDYIKGILSNGYKVVISDSNDDVRVKNPKIFKKIQNVEVVGELRHLSGMVVDRNLAHEAIINNNVIEAINKAPQYPQVPIGLYCASKFNIYKYISPVYEKGFDGVTGSNWTKVGLIPKYSTLSGRANQAESWLIMMNALANNTENNKAPFVFEIKKSLEEWLYILIEQGVVTTFDYETSFVFYRRSAINSFKWLVFNRALGKFLRYFFLDKCIK